MKAGEESFTRTCSAGIAENGFKITKGRFTLGLRKEFFTVRVVRHLIYCLEKL